MTTTTNPNLKPQNEENFGKVLLSANMSFYMERQPQVIPEVFNYLNEHFFKGIFNGGEDNKQMCKAVIDSNGEKHGGILYGWYTLSTGRKIMIKCVGDGAKEEQMNLELYSKADYNNTMIMFPSDD